MKKENIKFKSNYLARFEIELNPLRLNQKSLYHSLMSFLQEFATNLQ